MYVGKRVIVGLTMVGADNGVIEQKQLSGVISECDSTAGIVVSVDADAGGHFILPFCPDALVAATPGRYRCASSGVEVQNPEFLTSWIIRQDLQGKWHATPDRAHQRDWRA